MYVYMRTSDAGVQCKKTAEIVMLKTTMYPGV